MNIKVPHLLRTLTKFATAVAIAGPIALTGAYGQTPAKKLFGRKALPAVMKPAAYGFYSKGCVSGAVAIPKDGPTWQAMRPSRNRRWGHPELIELVIRLSQDANKVGWNGLLVGDISQPRGGPMLTGHASHQIGLDADIWLTEMPNRTLTYKERQSMSAVSMLARKSNGRINPVRLSSSFGKGQFNLIRTAARYGKVDRILVHPTIKRELCRIEAGDRKWLHKVRPYWGHYYHMHIRMGCPAGSPNCRPQAKPKADDGCGKEMDYWARLLNPPKRKKPKKSVKKKPRVKKKPKPQIRLADLPQACAAVLHASAPVSASAATVAFAAGKSVSPVLRAAGPNDNLPLADLDYIAVPKPRPQL